MAVLTLDQAKAALADWLVSFGKAADMREWYAHVTDRCTEFHPIYPALIEAPMFEGLQGARFGEPPRVRSARFTANEDVVRVWDDVILRVTAGTTERVESDGTISYHLNRETLLFVRVGGRWQMAHNHVSPAANDYPYGHNQFATGQLRFTQ